MKVADTMSQPLCASSWIDRFACRLLQLRPQMRVTTAVSYAVLSIHQVSELDPRRAAEDLARTRLIVEERPH